MHSGEKAGCVNSPDTVLRVRFPCNCHFYEKSEGFCQSLLPGRSCQESALRNRFLTEEEGGKKPKGSGDASDLLSGWSRNETQEKVCTSPKFERYRPHSSPDPFGATLSPGEGIIPLLPQRGPLPAKGIHIFIWNQLTIFWLDCIMYLEIYDFLSAIYQKPHDTSAFRKERNFCHDLQCRSTTHVHRR